ncbi:hypothetical protein GCM10022223_02250 [Kineosporia mesophila]|uniref:Uncharacterized protein n=1 Tax=Kineosporia mesophila TaxID=566012 RepID=A0ABP6YX33_9ACTN
MARRESGAAGGIRQEDRPPPSFIRPTGAFPGNTDLLGDLGWRDPAFGLPRRVDQGPEGGAARMRCRGDAVPGRCGAGDGDGGHADWRGWFVRGPTCRWLVV